MESSVEPNKHNNEQVRAATNPMNPHEQEEGDLAAQTKEKPDLTLSEGVALKNPPIPVESANNDPPPSFIEFGHNQGYEERVMDGISTKTHCVQGLHFI